MDARSRYIWKAVVGGAFPAVGKVWSSMDAMRWMDDYVSHRGLSYDDIKYPALTSAYGSVSSTASYVSSNIRRLYS